VRSIKDKPIAGILHADLDAFYASVEQRDNARLAGKAMAVGGSVILAASYQARALGVRTAMPLRDALELCPNLAVVPPRMEAYSDASAAVMDIFRDTTPLVEPISIDEAFLDVSGLRRLSGEPAHIAQGLRTRVASEVGLALSVGVARTKFLAKVASGVAKPDGQLVVEPHLELEILHPLPVQRLWGVGPKTAEKLAERGIVSVADVAAVGEAGLVTMLGTGSGRHLYRLAHNLDPRPVVTGRRRSSIGAQRALGSQQRSFDEHCATLLELVDRVCGRLRDGHRVGRTATLRFRFGDFSRDTRSRTLGESTASTSVFLSTAQDLLAPRRDEIRRRQLTLLGFTISNLSPADAVQQSLPFDARSSANLDEALDAIRTKHGSSSIGRARLVGRSNAVSVPLLPDPVLPL